jgi:hypothetical protein
MEFWIGLIGFSLAAYSVVGNDSIQTLGTFMCSNERVPWWGLWLYAGGILAITLVLGYLGLGELLGGDGAADLTFGKYDSMFSEGRTFPNLSWWFILPPLALLFITRWGLPVSTTFLVLSFFSLESLPKMLTKSLAGYGVAFAFAFAIYLVLIPRLERYFIQQPFAERAGLLRNKAFWTGLQWVSTGFLWSQWLTQDLVNILIYLGDPAAVSPGLFVFAAAILVGLLGLIFYQDGGKIQEIVRVKANSADIRSATLRLASKKLATPRVKLSRAGGTRNTRESLLAYRSHNWVISPVVQALGPTTGKAWRRVSGRSRAATAKRAMSWVFM